VKVDPEALIEPPDPSLLPEECPGWGKYDPSQPPCIVCDFTLDCMKVV